IRDFHVTGVQTCALPISPQLSARVASTDGRIHGYDVVEDLSRHYSFAEQTYLALTGALPDAAQVRAFEWALSILSATSIAEAPRSEERRAGREGASRWWA